MEIRYRNKKIKKECTDLKYCEKTYGRRMAEIITQRIVQIMAAENVEMLEKYRIGRCHQLKNNRSGQYAMDLVHPYRMIFEKINEEIEIAKIIEIVDYH